MVAFLLSASLLVMGAVSDGAEAEGGSARPALVYTAPGWKAELRGPVPESKQWESVRHGLQGRPEAFEDKLLVYRTFLSEPEGFWVRCDIDLQGHKLTVWKRTQAVVALAGGDTLRSECIIGSLDGPQTYLHDNRKSPFNVTPTQVFGWLREMPDGTLKSWPSLYLKFPRHFRAADVVGFWFEGITPQDD